jgi:hypothetical protein
MSKKIVSEMSTEEFEKLATGGDDEALLEAFEKDPNTVQRVNVDFPLWMLSRLDEEAHRLGIPRQAVIKTWLNDRINTEEHATSVEVAHLHRLFGHGVNPFSGTVSAPLKEVKKAAKQARAKLFQTVVRRSTEGKRSKHR